MREQNRFSVRGRSMQIRIEIKFDMASQTPIPRRREIFKFLTECPSVEAETRIAASAHTY